METLENQRRGAQLGERDRPGPECRGVTKHCIVTTGISGGSSGTLLDAMVVWRATRGLSGCHGREPKAWNDRHGLGDEPCGDARIFLRSCTWRSLIIRKMSAPRVRPKERK